MTYILCMLAVSLKEGLGSGEKREENGDEVEPNTSQCAMSSSLLIVINVDLCWDVFPQVYKSLSMPQ